MQHFLFLHPQRWLGVSHPINTAEDYVIKPLETIPNDPALQSALAEYKAAPEKQKKEWSEAYAKPLEEYATAAEEKKPPPSTVSVDQSTGTVTVKASGAGPVPVMMASLQSLAQSGGLEGGLVSSSQFFQTDYTKPLLFMADGGLLAERAEAQHLLGEQWGLMNETGSYPGQPWLWLYALWYQVEPMKSSPNADIQVLLIMGLLSLAFICIRSFPASTDPAPQDPDLQADLERALPLPAGGLSAPASAGARRSRRTPVLPTAWRTIAAMNTDPPGPLSPDQLDLLDAYWRAANYLSVGQIYLLDNPLLREPLRIEHVKPRLLGHWGTTPGLNFIYAHLNRVIRERDLNAIYVAGPGHGGPGVVANVYLEGTYSEVYPHIGHDERGPAAAVPPVLLPRRHPQPRRARDAGLDPRGRRARLLARCTPTAPCSTTPTCSPAAWSATARPRPGRWPRAGTRTSSSTPSATARCCRCCTSTATRSPTRRCSRGSPRGAARAARGLRLRAALRRGRRPAGDAPADGRHARRGRSRRSPQIQRARARRSAERRGRAGR